MPRLARLRAFVVIAMPLAACTDEPGIAAPAKPDGGVDAGADAGPVPSDPDGGACAGPDCARLALAFTRFFVGDTDRGGTPLHYAWEYYGEDYDGLHSNYLLNGECLPPEALPQYAPLDGINGYDNEWGSRILPLLEPWDKTPSKTSSDALRADARRPLILLGQLGGGLAGATLRAFFTSVVEGRAEPAATTYESATFDSGTFDSGPSPSPVAIDLALGAQPFRVLVHRLRIRFELTADGRALAGQLSGAITVADLQTAVLEHVGRSAPGECGGTKLGDLAKSIANAPDVLSNGRHDPTARCDAVSFGVGFEAETVRVTGTARAPDAPAPACP